MGKFLIQMIWDPYSFILSGILTLMEVCVSARLGRVSSREVSILNENGLVHGFSALIKFGWGQVNLNPFTKKEIGRDISKVDVIYQNRQLIVYF